MKKTFGVLVFSFLLLFIFFQEKTSASEFNLSSINLGIGSTAPNTLGVIVTNPPDGSTVSDLVNISADASSSASVTQIDFYVDYNLLGSDFDYPYNNIWDTKTYSHNSQHTLFAVAFDNLGNVASSSAVLVTVSDITSPSVVINSPINGGIVPKNSTVNITATATDISAIDRVEFYVNGVLKCTDGAANYSCSWQVPAKKNVVYTLQAKGFDIAGNSSTSTVTVTAK